MAYKSKKWIASIFASSIITFSIVAGTSFALYYSSNKLTLNDEFARSYNFRIELQDDGTGFDDVRLQQTANSFAEYLKFCDIEKYKNVYFEHNGNQAFLNFTLPITKNFPVNILSSEYDQNNPNKAKWDVPAATELVNTINSNHIDFILDCDTHIATEKGQIGKIPTKGSNKAFVTTFNIQDLVDSPSSISLDKNNRIIINLKSEANNHLTSKNFLNLYEHLFSPTIENTNPTPEPKKNTVSLNNSFVFADPAPAPTPNPAPNPDPKKPDETPTANPSKPEIYIIRDKNALITKMHYILNCYAVYFLFHNADDHKWIENDSKLCSYFYGYTFLTSDEKNWADTVFKEAFLSNSRLVNSFPNFALWLNGNLLSCASSSALAPYGKWNEVFKSIDENEKFFLNPVADVSSNYINSIEPLNSNFSEWKNDDFTDTFFYRLIDCAKSTIFEINGEHFNGEQKIPAATNHKDTSYIWEWMKPYVVGIINQENFTKFFPEKDPNDSSAKSDKKNVGKWIVLGNNGSTDLLHNTNSEINLLYHSLLPYSESSYRLYYNFKIISEPLNTQENSIWKTSYTQENPIEYLNENGMFSSFIKNHAFLYNDKKINDGLIVSNPFISTLIGIALIVLLIGIIVSILYRVPGLLYILNLISVCGLSIVLFVLTGKTISLGLTIGIITGIILLTLCFLLLMQRIKKHTMKEDFIINSLKKGFTKGVWQTIDILIVSLICGLCFLFFCGKLFADFGLSLLLFSVISIIGIGLWSLSNFLLFGNSKMERKVKLVFISKTLPEKIENNIEQQTTFMQVKKFNKFNLFGKWREIIPAISIGAIILLGIILAFTLGLKNSYEIFGGTRILILKTDNQNNLYNQVLNLGLDFYNIQKQSDFWVLFTRKNIYSDQSLLNNLQTILGNNGFVQKIETFEMLNEIKQLLLGILILSAFVTLYSLIRINWIVAVPVFLSVWIQTLSLLSFSLIFQIQLNTESIQFIPLYIVFNTLITVIFVGNLTNKWIKNKNLDYSQLKDAFNAEIKSSIINYFIYVFGLLFIICLIFSLFSSTSFMIPFIFFFFQSIFSLFILLTVTKSILPIFAILRYKFLIRVSQNNIFSKNNFDKIDEQNIEGINKHKYIKISL